MNSRIQTTQRLCVLLLGLLICALPAIGLGTEGKPESVTAGHIIAGSGRLIARGPDGTERRLRRRSPIYTGDTIIVGDNAFIQLRFSDGGLTSLRPGTEFKVSEYHFNGEQDGSEKAVFELVKGGLRTISGAIGKKNKENYQLNTPVSTIGIRGTHYGLNLCSAGCATPEGETLPAGLYGGVVDGAIVVTNEGGEALIGNDGYFYVNNNTSAPQQLLAPPGIVFDQAEGELAPSEPSSEDQEPAATGETDSSKDDTADSTTSTTADSTEDTTVVSTTTDSTLTDTTLITSTDPVFSTTGSNTTGTTLGGQLAPEGSVAGIAAIGGPDDHAMAELVAMKGGSVDNIYIDTINGTPNMVVRVTHEEAPDCLTCEISKGTATLTTDGMPTDGFTMLYPDEKVYWGRWENGWYGQDSYGGGTGQGSWHFIYSPNVTSKTDMDFLRVNNVSATFSQWSPGDGTIPTDELGNLGTYTTQPRFDVNFGAGTISNYNVAVSFTGSGRSFNGAQTADVAFNGPGAQIPLYVSCSGCSTSMGSGQGNIIFVGTKASHALSSWEMHSEDDVNAAVGTILFTNDSIP